VASISYPRSGYNAGSITSVEHERLTHAVAPDGVLGTPADSPVCYADGTGTRAVKVRADKRALVRGSQYDSGSTETTLNLAENASGQPRIDMVVLRLDRSGYTVTETVIQGTPGASPVAPSLTYDTGATGNWDFPLVEVAVANGATTLNSGNLTTRHWYINDDGHIACTATTRPQHQAARRFFQTDTGLWYFSDGTNYKIDGEWTAVSTLSSSAASVSFTGIPSNLRKLEVHWTARDDWAAFEGSTLFLRVNNDSGTNYRNTFIQNSNTTVTGQNNLAQTRAGLGIMARGGATANTFGSGRVTFPAWNAPHSTHLGFTFQSIMLDSTAAKTWTTSGGGSYLGAGPYTRLDFFPEQAGQNFVAGTQFYLIGRE
jgi:hypothetical protein